MEPRNCKLQIVPQVCPHHGHSINEAADADRSKNYFHLHYYNLNYHNHQGKADPLNFGFWYALDLFYMHLDRHALIVLVVLRLHQSVTGYQTLFWKHARLHVGVAILQQPQPPR